MLINEATRDFIRRHADDDVRRLALQGTKSGEVDLMQALQQIAGRQTARRKLPSWAEVDDIVYPPHLNMEQCSSEQTARYKAQIVNCKLSNCKLSNGKSFVDLTGGFGVDFYWMSKGFESRAYVEQDAELCAIAEANFRLLGLSCSVSCANSAAYLTEMEHADVIFLDPARRNEHGGRTYSIEDCSPNVMELLPLLMEKADMIVLKLSPMLDWRKAVSDLKHVAEVHIVSVDNECKELLLVLGKEATGDLRLVCVNNSQILAFSPSLRTPSPKATDSEFVGYGPERPSYLYEPNASIMKAGCFDELAARFPVSQVAANSHLFLSTDEIEDFPGRGFQISAISSMNKKEIGEKLSGVKSANIAVRNFPMTADQLRKKLKLKDGGPVYIFATTAQDGSHELYICRKIG